MFKRTIDSAARTRFAFPVVISLAVFAAIVNEGMYQHTRGSVSNAIALTDARMQASQALQSITQMEASARAVQDNNQQLDRERFDKASAKFSLSLERTLGLIAQVDPEGQVAVEQMRKLGLQQAERYRTWLNTAATSFAANGRTADAAHNDAAKFSAENAALHREFEEVLARAAELQRQSRLSIFDSLLLNRTAVHALLALALLALFMFVREVRLSAAARVRETERLAEQVEARTAELRDLADHLVSIREDERARLARELHDEMGGLLTAMKLELARLRRVQDLPPSANDRISSINERLNEGVAFKRRIVENLRPSSLDQLGLKVALELLCTDAAAVMGIPVHVAVQELSLGKDADLTVFRVVQESLTNIAKYAAARNVWVDLTAADGLASLCVRDDGSGFNTSVVTTRRHGLLGMRMRLEVHKGSLQVHSRVGGGTQVLASLPMPSATSLPTPAQLQPLA